MIVEMFISLKRKQKKLFKYITCQYLFVINEDI